MTYGGYTEDGTALAAVPLDSHGIVDEGGFVRCNEKELVSGEYITELEFGFTSIDLISLAYKINDNLGLVTFGADSQDEELIKTRPVTFSPASIMFFSFNGRTAGSFGQLKGLGIIGYDALCVE